MPRPRTLLRPWPQLIRYSSTSTVDLSKLQRDLFRRVAQPVAVLTAHIPHSNSQEPVEASKHNHGATLSSLTSISIDPPLISFSLRLPSRLASHISPSTSSSTHSTRNPSFKLHLLSPSQEKYARLFARQAPLPAPAAPSSNTDWSIEPTFDSKVFNQIERDGLGWLEGRVVRTIDLWNVDGGEGETNDEGERMGRSQLFIVRVENIEIGKDENSDGSLVWMEQSYRAVKSEER